MNQPTLESQWIIYRDACYPVGLPKNQEIETRQAFFSGCLVVLKFAVESSQAMPEDQAFGTIVGLISEAQMVCSMRVSEMKARN